MLRGRCSCTISERPIPSPFAPPSLFYHLTPLFPLHTRHSPVTPLFPLLTQKQGVYPPLQHDQSFHFGILPGPIPCFPSLLRLLSALLCALCAGVYPDPVGALSFLLSPPSCTPWRINIPLREFCSKLPVFRHKRQKRQYTFTVIYNIK